ncbi:C-C motif chemokine 8-like [Anabas testudineus]|uniref:C-C motif chemokine 8-like n=1 Tax=Anabas testudineus TaxID=64144 RepID=UPI000E462A7D|nr:C-C motif chemokine 8-like [Anabas testudineus]
MLKSVLVTILLVAVAESGSIPMKLASCCVQVTKQEITEPILGYLVQIKSIRPCVSAVIFQTEKGLFCVHPRAPWVVPKIRAFERGKRPTTPSPSVSPSGVSLLSIITSTASPSPPSFSSTSETPVGENISDQNE